MMILRSLFFIECIRTASAIVNGCYIGEDADTCLSRNAAEQNRTNTMECTNGENEKWVYLVPGSSFNRKHPLLRGGYARKTSRSALGGDIWLLEGEKEITSFEGHKVYGVGGTSLYLDLNHAKVTVSHITSDQDYGVFVLCKFKVSVDNQLISAVNIGRSRTSWIKVVGNEAILAAEATTFHVIKTGNDVKFEYKDQYMAYDEQDKKIVMVPKTAFSSETYTKESERFAITFFEFEIPDL